MTIQDFAKKYRLKITKDSCDEPVVQGRLYKDANISEHAGMMALCFLVDGRAGKPSRQGLFNRVRQECLDASMAISQEGDSEAVFVFDGADEKQSRLVIRTIRAKVRKVLSEETRMALAARLANARAAKRAPAGQPTV
jgi:hypothetical protein